jgi:FkbM family methyltransferase
VLSGLLRRGLRAIALVLPRSTQRRIRQSWNARRIRTGDFTSEEPEFARLAEWVRPGDWVLDIGANVGHYTLRLSSLVGPAGRVIAFEPVPETFAILAANCGIVGCRNVSLINAAASANSSIVTMSIPTYEDGLTNFYQARIDSTSPASGLSILTLAVDGLNIPSKLALVKIDAEGHESSVLAGLVSTIARARPVVIMENSSRDSVSQLKQLGYQISTLPGSPNVLGMPEEVPARTAAPGAAPREFS